MNNHRFAIALEHARSGAKARRTGEPTKSESRAQ